MSDGARFWRTAFFGLFALFIITVGVISDVGAINRFVLPGREAVTSKGSASSDGTIAMARADAADASTALRAMSPVPSASHTPAATPSPSSSPSKWKCPTENIDIFIVSAAKEYPLLSFLMRSIEAFMPCHGHVHLVVDRKDQLRLASWVDISDPRVHLHFLEWPDILKHINGYFGQEWIMMWADEMAQKAGSNPDYIMFFDTDSVLGLPVTCNSLFDKDGKVYIVGWTIGIQHWMGPPSEDMIGPTDTSYMSYFPFTQPTVTFPRMRNHIVKKLGFPDGYSFDLAFGNWTLRPDVEYFRWSQFVVMGTYLELFEKDLVHIIKCPNYHDGNRPGHECHKWTSTGTHYGWRYCHYVGSCRADYEGVMYYRRQNGGDFEEKFTNKYGIRTVDLIEEVIQYGVCYKQYLEDQTVLPTCTHNMTRSVHWELLPYPADPPKIEWMDAMFKPDPPNQVCKSVSLTY